MKEAELGAQNYPPIPAGKDLPDVYYIILDTYARDDVLKQEYGFDNSTFLEALQQMGFYIGECSQSNYGQTTLSLASSLNMNYLTELGSFTPDSTDRNTLINLIEYSAVRTNLEARGYKTVSLSAFEPLKIESAAVIDLCVAKRTHSKSRWVWRTKAMSKSASCPAAWIESVTA